MKTGQQTDEATPAIDSAILTVLQHHRCGTLLTDLSEGLREATEAARREGKQAVLTLKIILKPAGKVPGALTIQDDVKVTLPKPERVESIFFADENGALHRNDPRQKELPLKMVDGGRPMEVETLKVAAQA